VSFEIKSQKDFWTGCLYLGFGAAAYWIARDYPVGSASRMGAGYFPSLLSGLLMLIGVLSLLRSLVRRGAPLNGFAWRKAGIIFAATFSFAFLLERAGLLIALAVLILGSASASVKFRLEWRAILAAIGLIVFCALVFVKGLSLPMPLFGSWFES